ncbi:MAG: hypothetical protein JWM26_2663 [Betaproteobacteria bacterium]|nr:hypothetical protein [Betaproteobacteria bacterium]
MLEAALRLLPVREPFQAQPVDATHRYMHFRPNYDFTYSMGLKFDIVNKVHVNNYGYVNGQDYDASATTPLLAVIGDSYIEAAHVPYAQSLQGRLAQSVTGRARVYSFASSGAALSQYLAYAEFARDTFRPAALAVLVISNDFDESLLEYKSDPGHHYFTPTADGSYALELIPFTPSLLHRALRMSALARYVHGNDLVNGVRRRIESVFGGRTEQFVGNVASDADDARVEKSKRAVDHFLKVLPQYAGVAPDMIVLLVDGVRPELYDERQLKAAESSYASIMREYLIAQARRYPYRTVDLQPRFIERHQRDGARFEWPIDSHWNATGHEEAAAAVTDTGILQRLLASAGGAKRAPADGESTPAAPLR